MRLLHAAILAAGLSQRFGSPKMLADLHGRPLLQRVVDVARAVVGDRYQVVLGPRGDSSAQIIEACALESAHIVQNEKAASGIASSLILAVESTPASAEALLVLLGDQAAITSEDLQRLIDGWRGNPHFAAAASYANVIGAPCILPRALFPEVTRLQGDRGAQVLLKSLTYVHRIEMPTAALDIDSTADLERWRARTPPDHSR